MYQRDRGELDWDARSISTTNMMSDTASLYPSKGQFYDGGRSSPAPAIPGYNTYLAHGTQASEIELSQLNLPYVGDEQPLLPGTQSTSSLPGYATPPQTYEQYPPPPGVAPVYHSNSPSDGYREAPMHRPYPSRQASGYAPSQAGPPGPVNMAGRGAYRG